MIFPLFAQFFLEKTNEELNKNIQGFDDDVMHVFLSYSWPGNLREFRNVVRRAVLLTNTSKLLRRHYRGKSPILISFNKPSHTHETVTVQPSFTTSLPGKEIDLKDAAAKAEYETIMSLLKEVNNNKSKQPRY